MACSRLRPLKGLKINYSEQSMLQVSSLWLVSLESLFPEATGIDSPHGGCVLDFLMYLECGKRCSILSINNTIFYSTIGDSNARVTGAPSILTQMVAGSVPICSILYPFESDNLVGIVTGTGISQVSFVPALTVTPVICCVELEPALVVY
jgi:hypothetical protein